MFNSIVSLLEIRVPDGGAGRGRYGGPRNAAAQFNQAFGFDPSERRDEIKSSIPQALAMMNSPMINQGISARRNAGLGRLLSEVNDDEALTVELYLKALSRQPTAAEIKICLDYVQEVGNRAEAFEDVLWSLINSTEFLHRR